jgi:hypothetical protein
MGQVDDKVHLKSLHEAFMSLRETKTEENPWLVKSLFCFTTRSSVNSSLAVSMWRLMAASLI